MSAKVEIRSQGDDSGIRINGHKLPIHAGTIELGGGKISKFTAHVITDDLQAFLENSELTLIVVNPETKVRRILRSVHFQRDGWKGDELDDLKW